jgi:hypothetical protein
MQLLVCIRVKLHQIYHEISPDKHGAHASAFVEPVHSIAIGIKPPEWYAIDRNADRLQKNTVGCTGQHLRDQRYARIIFPNQLFGRSDYFWVERRRNGEKFDRGNHSDLDTRIAATRAARVPSTVSPGKIRQLTFAAARCGNALLA